MRILGVGVVAAAVLAGACNRAEQATSTPAPVTSDATDAANGSAPVATTGTDPAASAPPSDPSPLRSLFTREPEWREVTIPAGTRLPVTLETAIGSDISHIEEPVQARLSKAITVAGATALPAGSRVSGVVTDATRSAKVKGRAHVAVRFDTVIPEGPDVANERYTIAAGQVRRTAPATKKDDAVKIGAPAAGGAIVGALVGGKKGAAIGSAVGGGAGTAVVLSTRGKEVRLGRGAALTLQLSEPLTVRVRANADHSAAR
jgi:hypothetical protein